MFPTGTGQTPQSPFGQHSFFMHTSPTATSMIPTSQYFYQRQSPPPHAQYSPTSSLFTARNRYMSRNEECEPMSTSPIHSHQTVREYLPAYLTGEISPSYSKGISSCTPEKRRHTVSFADSNTMHPDSAFHREQPKTPPKQVQGPPTSGIGRVNENSSSPFFAMIITGTDKDSLNTSTGFIPTMLSPGLQSLPPQSPTTSSWVTVFGFPAVSTATVLAHFGNCGIILESKTVPGSNWVHLHYSNVIEARRALQKNGTLIGGSMMVGVTPCTEPMVAKDGSLTGSPDFLQNPASPPPSSSTTVTESATGNKENVDPLQPTTLGNSGMTVLSPTSAPDQLRSRMRSLGRDASDIQVPQQNSGLVAWALDKFFGW